MSASNGGVGGPSPRRALGIVLAVAAGARLIALVASGGLAAVGDESSYLGAAREMLEHGRQDVFWPPLTSWLLALVMKVVGVDDLFALRAAMSALDLVNVGLVHAVALRLPLPSEPDADARRDAEKAAFLASLGYALYLPAIGFAACATSEVPTVALVLSALRLALATPGTLWHVLGAALALGLATLARSNLALLPVAFAGALHLRGATSSGPTRLAMPRWVSSLVFVAVASLPPLGWTVRNQLAGHGAVLSTNASYNLYVGNSPDFQEDLDLFSPAATASQRAVRAGATNVDAETARALSPRDRTARALAFIRDRPATFLRRALGRLGRVFVPKTAHLTLVGGEGRAGLSAPAPMALLLVALGQWALVLPAGLVGLAWLHRTRARGFELAVATVLGALPLCLVAVSKPRYAFPFEPVLIVCAAVAFGARARLQELSGRARTAVAGALLFGAWAWIAWFVFAWTSRA